MPTLLFLLALAAVIVMLYLTIAIARGNRSIEFLADVAPAEAPHPRVSIIVTALNEERNIEEALHSLLAQDYPNLEYIVIDDRSTDRTGLILDRIAREHPALRVVHIRELPEGWLGKCHALYRGAKQAAGEILLFTDADIVMEPSAVSRAVGHLRRRGLAHLAVTPRMLGGDPMTRALFGAFGLFFTLYAVPWEARNPRSTRHIGIGAFNLIRRDAYFAIGAHQAIAMRPDDDMKLGKLVKKNGLRQDVLFGRDMVAVEWYASVPEMIRGLTKNAFAGVEYKVSAILASTAAQFAFFVWPFLGVFFTGGWTRLLNLSAALLIILLCRDAAPFHGARPPRPWAALLFPAATLIFIYIMWRSMTLTLLHRGIDWRGTHYPLDKLKANRV